MNTPNSDPIDDWSDEALVEMFRELPDLAPSSGFAARVVAARRRRIALHRAGRGAVVAAVGLVGLSLPWLFFAAQQAVGAVRPASLLTAWLRAGVSVWHGWIEMLDFWQSLSGLRGAAWLVATSPPVLAGTALIALLSALALRVLADLIPSRRPRYALS